MKKVDDERIADLVHVLTQYYDDLNKEIGQTVFKTSKSDNNNKKKTNNKSSKFIEEQIYVNLIEYLSTLDNLDFINLLARLKQVLPEKYVQLLIDIKTNYVIF